MKILYWTLFAASLTLMVGTVLTAGDIPPEKTQLLLFLAVAGVILTAMVGPLFNPHFTADSSKRK